MVMLEENLFCLKGVWFGDIVVKLVIVEGLLLFDFDEIGILVCWLMRVGIWVNFFLEVWGDGGVGVFLESIISFCVVGDGDVGWVVIVIEVVWGDVLIEVWVEGDVGWGVNFIEDDVRWVVWGVGFIEGEVG